MNESSDPDMLQVTTSDGSGKGLGECWIGFEDVWNDMDEQRMNWKVRQEELPYKKKVIACRGGDDIPVGSRIDVLAGDGEEGGRCWFGYPDSWTEDDYANLKGWKPDDPEDEPDPYSKNVIACYSGDPEEDLISESEENPLSLPQSDLDRAMFRYQCESECHHWILGRLCVRFKSDDEPNPSCVSKAIRNWNKHYSGSEKPMGSEGHKISIASDKFNPFNIDGSAAKVPPAPVSPIPSTIPKSSNKPRITRNTLV